MFYSRLLLLSAVMFFFSCSKKKNITHVTDYNEYLNAAYTADKEQFIKKEIIFWTERLLKDTGSYVNKAELAVQYLSLFRVNGEINNLIAGDSLLRNASAKLKHTNPELLYSLSQNSIAQHQFTLAADYAKAATTASGDPFTICLLQFDAQMELGNYGEAFKALQSLADKSSFDYLIRKAKWEDHKGNLDEAIKLMETAFEKVKNKKKSLYVWTLSNLGDMYGHAGRVEEAYTAYLDVLKKEPGNLYCLKGIAWMAWSHEKNGKEAKRILQFILSQNQMPELKLLLAEIAAEEGNKEEAMKWKREFMATVSKPGYGAMYNKYLIEMYNEDKQLAPQALPLAEAELKHRFTPETNDWLAWTYYNMGETTKAYEIASRNVFEKTFEPDALIHTAYIFAANGKKAEAKAMLKDCLESSFEIGPVTTKEIKEMLASL